MKKNIKCFFALLYLIVFMTGCEALSETKSSSNDEISFSKVVCKYSSTPSYGTVTDFITLNIIVKDDNIIEVYCGDFSDKIDSETEINIDYIYGETFNISKEQKQSIITAIEENKIDKLTECGDENSCDGSYRYISLFDSNGEEVHKCGGLNPSNEEFENVYDSILKVLPTDAIKNIYKKSEEILKKQLLEKYPDHYSWLNQ